MHISNICYIFIMNKLLIFYHMDTIEICNELILRIICIKRDSKFSIQTLREVGVPQEIIFHRKSRITIHFFNLKYQMSHSRQKKKKKKKKSFDYNFKINEDLATKVIRNLL